MEFVKDYFKANIIQTELLNKRAELVILYPSLENEDIFLEFITKLIQATKFNSNQTAMIKIANNKNNLLELEDINPQERYILLFGERAKSIFPNISFNEYQWTKVQNCFYLGLSEAKDIIKNVDMKKALWNALKQKVV